MSAPLRVGLAGLGSMGRNHLRHLSTREDCDLVAVADPDAGLVGDAVAKTGAAGLRRCPRDDRRGPPRRGGDRRADDGARLPRARRDRARPAGPGREAAGRDRRGGDRARRRGPRARRPPPGRARGAVQPGRAGARSPDRQGLGGDALLHHQPPRRTVPRADPRRRRDDRPRDPRRGHPVVDRRRASHAGLRRDGAAAARQQRGPAVRAAALPVGRDRHAGRQLADARRSGGSSPSWANRACSSSTT